jgi:hypothetical protein
MNRNDVARCRWIVLPSSQQVVQCLLRDLVAGEGILREGELPGGVQGGKAFGSEFLE